MNPIGLWSVQMTKATINCPNELRGLNNFQVQAVNQAIIKIAKEYNIGFDFDNYEFRFYVYDLNIKFHIEYSRIFDRSAGSDSYYLKWLLAYIDKVKFQLLNDIDIVWDVNHELSDDDRESVEDYSFLCWSLIKRNVIKQNSTKVIA